MSDTCPNCRVPLSNPWIPCVKCGHSAVGEPDAFVSDPQPRNRQKSKPGSGRWLLMAGYAGFVLVPVLCSAGLLYFFLRPSPDQATNSQPAAPSRGPEPEPEPKPRAVLKSNDKSAFAATAEKKEGARLGSVPSRITANLETAPYTVEPESKPKIEHEIAPPPRVVKVFGILRLTTEFAVRNTVEAWVEIDGKKQKDWVFGTTQVELKLEAGPHAVRVIAKYNGNLRVVYEGEVEVPANRVKEVKVGESKKEGPMESKK